MTKQLSFEFLYGVVPEETQTIDSGWYTPTYQIGPNAGQTKRERIIQFGSAVSWDEIDRTVLKITQSLGGKRNGAEFRGRRHFYFFEVL